MDQNYPADFWEISARWFARGILLLRRICSILSWVLPILFAVCMCVCMYVCVCMCVCIWPYATSNMLDIVLSLADIVCSMYVYVCLYVFLCMFVCMYMAIRHVEYAWYCLQSCRDCLRYVCLCMHVYKWFECICCKWYMYVCLYVYVCVCMCMYVCVCMCVYV